MSRDGGCGSGPQLSALDSQLFPRRLPIDTEEKLATISKILNEKKALAVEVVDLAGKTSMCDYFVICSGTSNTHIQSIVDGLLEDGKPLGLKKSHMEGYQSAKWVLLDYGDIVVHVFAQEERAYYDIESLWRESAARLESTDG